MGSKELESGGFEVGSERFGLGSEGMELGLDGFKSGSWGRRGWSLGRRCLGQGAGLGLRKSEGSGCGVEFGKLGLGVGSMGVREDWG